MFEKEILSKNLKKKTDMAQGMALFFLLKTDLEFLNQKKNDYFILKRQ